MSLPIGAIVLWKNNAAAVPTGWQVCDGTNGTPDLRGFFVYGATADGDVGATGGGSHLHTRPANTGTGGYHRHTISVSVANTSDYTNDVNDIGASGVNVAPDSHSHNGISGYTGYDTAAHSHTVGGNTAAADILPPYIKLYYIMRIL